MSVDEKEKPSSPQGQKDYKEFLSKIPGYFEDTDLVDTINEKINNTDVSQRDYTKLVERGLALVRSWSKKTDGRGSERS